jgi:hypothetical protein
MFYEDNIVITQIIFRRSSIPGRIGNVDFCGGRKTGEKPSKKRRESTTNSTDI